MKIKVSIYRPGMGEKSSRIILEKGALIDEVADIFGVDFSRECILDYYTGTEVEQIECAKDENTYVVMPLSDTTQILKKLEELSAKIDKIGGKIK